MKILNIFGTRPEVIKFAPIIVALNKHKITDHISTVTGQQREMLDQALGMFGIKTQYDLHLMIPNQTLAHITSKVLEGIGDILEKERPNMVLVQGDTTTALAAGLASYYNRIPVGHIEAGLRTNDIYSPFPEEMNRRLLSQIAAIHFAPTEQAAKNLTREGIDPGSIHITGNTVVDALKVISRKNPKFRLPALQQIDFVNQRVILLTTHRRENLGQPMAEIFRAVKKLARQYPDVLVVFAVHPNPAIKALAKDKLAGVANVLMLPPLDYPDLVLLLKKCYFVLTDSGGIQEEAPTFGKPVLVLRDTTERPEGIKSGVAKLVGANYERIIEESKQLLDEPSAYRRMSKAQNPYGDGRAAERIVEAIVEYHRSH